MQNNTQSPDGKIISILLKDRTTGKNIIWATDNYKKYGENYNSENQITQDLLVRNGESVIKPRTQKSKFEQKKRVAEKAEVFTPSWICNMQNNLVDDDWFEKNGTFNKQNDINHVWKTSKEKTAFSDAEGKNWKDFVKRTMLELTCGEAPYITSRYDSVSGNFIEVPDRVGFLDRKLRVVSENTDTKEEWLEWAEAALKSVYGFEFQGDSLLIARENVLLTVIEHYGYKFTNDVEDCRVKPDNDTDGRIENNVIPALVRSLALASAEILETFAEIISWNLWQMDGLKFVVPNSCKTKDVVEQDLFETRVISKACEGCKTKNPLKHNGIYCRIKDWQSGKTVRFADCLNEPEEK